MAINLQRCLKPVRAYSASAGRFPHWASVSRGGRYKRLLQVMWLGLTLSSSLCILTFSDYLFSISFSGPPVDLNSRDKIFPGLKILSLISPPITSYTLFAFNKSYVYISFLHGGSCIFLLSDCKLVLLSNKSVLPTIFELRVCSPSECLHDVISLLKFTCHVTVHTSELGTHFSFACE